MTINSVERIYDPQAVYFPTTSLLHEEEGMVYTQGVSPSIKNPNGPSSTHIHLKIRFGDEVRAGNGTVVGPRHVLTSGDLVYTPQGWASKIKVENISNMPPCKVVRVYAFKEWTEQHNPHYNIALLILGKSIGKHAGWSGMLSVPDSFLYEERVHVLKAPHTVQKIEIDEVCCAPKLNADQTGAALSANHWKTTMVLGLVTLDRDHKPLALRLSKQKVHALAQKISENFKKYPKTAFGKAQWAKYFGDVGEEPPLPASIKEILKAQCPVWPDKKVYETHLLTLIPKTVNGEPLTLKTLGELVKNPPQGSPSRYRDLSLGQYQDIPPEYSYWTLLSRDVIPGSRSKSYAHQQELIQQYPGYEVPHVLDTTVALFMEHVQNGVRLYSDDPWTCTRCQEKYHDQRQLVVGGFAVGGLRVDYYYLDLEGHGVGVARKFH
jgi:hypothetical protein